MGVELRRIVLTASAVLGVGLVAACGPKSTPPPPPPPPPPKPVVVIPPKPYPPNNAAGNMVIPALASDGLYQSVNRGISPAQTTWNLRSGYNVAALSCQGAARDEIFNPGGSPAQHCTQRGRALDELPARRTPKFTFCHR